MFHFLGDKLLTKMTENVINNWVLMEEPCEPRECLGFICRRRNYGWTG